MKPELRRIARLRRLERIRAIARQTAAAETAEAEGALAQLRRLTDRTNSMAQDYVARDNALDGFELQQTACFVSGLFRVAASTGAEAITAQGHADRKMAQLAAAERRRAAVAQRADMAQRHYMKSAETPIVGARRKSGTEVE